MRSTDHATRFRFGVEAPRPRAMRAASGAVVTALLSLLLTGVDGEKAHAAAYPSWQDVQNAKSSESATAAKVDQISALIGKLETAAAAAGRLAISRGRELETAQDAFDEAAFRANELQEQAKDARQEAEAARISAGRLAAQLHRGGNNDITVSLLLSALVDERTGEAPEELLARLSTTSLVVQKSSRILDRARAAENTARSVTAQAAAARNVRETRRVAAAAALTAAQGAAMAAQASLSEQDEQVTVLRAQLAALKDTTTRTVAAYQAGVEEERRQQAANTRPPSGGSNPGGGGSGSGGAVGGQGWAVPARGIITSPFGPRSQPCPNCTSNHRGVDIGASCSAPIYAASAGTVVYAGPQGTYGNFVLVDHGGGVSTGYAHIVNGGILVGIGNRVAAGKQIALVGKTGAATGCHLHYEVRTNGVAIDPVPFMRQRGVPLG